MKGYRFIEHMGEGNEVLHHHRYGNQIWTRVKVRKHKECIVTGEVLKGKEGYLPIGNAGNRMERISKEGMKQIIDFKY